MTIRMKDIARDLGLSQATVSKVLRDHPDIGESTRRRVLERVKELDYQPNSLARSLVTGRSFLIGLIAPSLLHPFFAEIAIALSDVIRDRGYSLIVSSSEEDAEREKEEISRLLGRHMDALIIASVGSDIQQFERMNSKAQPYVLIDRDLDGVDANFVGINDKRAGYLATEHLVSMGCRRIAHIRGQDNSPGNGRFEGYKEALRDNNLFFSNDYVVRRNYVDIETTRRGAEAMRLLLERNPKPDGVFCFNDPLAIGAMSTILESGLRIPEDIALIGCGNLPNNDWLRVPLSSIDQRSQMVGQHAAELALNLIESKQMPHTQTTVLEPTLVIRSSTQKKRNK
ncbi:LacI family DNA-binding transcriptional regulator [Edaphobacter dinghuensis]|uniref:LacI family transcriptional regulator n=1 Tax=Edaphobacter dinghuensis TaxID=1560005 RepID=A0A917H073_9BACT|nr:LacI family DNA-binding transcriptional regulator [Edaphobacter dinghuensis]GGG63262.1 LacI family transcriptional regulator [Edaphobacter dinghuensis]